MVDECHLIPKKSNTMYRKFINFLRKVNPQLKVIGLTATPYRVGMGNCVSLRPTPAEYMPAGAVGHIVIILS